MAGLALGAILIGISGCGALSSKTPTGESATSLLRGAQAPAAPFSGTTTFKLVQNTIQIHARLDGAVGSGPFILDSGAPMTIAPRLSSELKLESPTEITLAGPDGRHEPAPVVRIPRTAVAGQTFRDVGAVVDWVKAPNPVACLSKDGLLGASLLRTAIWQIDFHAGRLTVTDDLATLPGLEYAMRLPFHRADAAGSPRIDIDLGEARGESLLIDLGFNGGLAIPPETYLKAGGKLTVDTPAQRGHGAATVLGDTKSTLYIGRIREVRLGGLKLRDFPALTGGEVSDLHVGIAFLRHFRVTLDWQNDELYLQRRDPEEALYEDYAAYGFTPILRDGALEIGALWRNGSAATAGLKIGDPILSIDDRSFDRPDFETFCSLLDAIGLYGSRTKPAEVTVRRDGEPISVTVERAPLVPPRNSLARGAARD